MFENIGGKIKGLALIIFAFEAFGAVIWGLILMGEEQAGLGFLIIVAGAVVAWLSTCLLYAFGELVEATCENESNTRAILNLLQEQKREEEKKERAAKQAASMAVEKPKAAPAREQAVMMQDNVGQPSMTAEIIDGKKICPKCGKEQNADRSVCWACGLHFDN